MNHRVRIVLCWSIVNGEVRALHYVPSDVVTHELDDPDGDCVCGPTAETIERGDWPALIVTHRALVPAEA